MAQRGVVAAGHPVTAEAGARVLREGGNAVDAAVAAVMASCVTESPLTGLGAGGYMLVRRGSEAVVLDFFVAAPGADGIERGSELVPITVHFTEHSAQVFHVGAASCGVPGTPAGLERAVEQFGTMPLAELAAPAALLARDGVEVNAEQAYFIAILAPILTHYEAAPRDLRARRRPARRRGPVSLPGARRRARAARVGGRGAVLPRGGRRAGSPSGSSSAAAPSEPATSPPTSRFPGSR